MNDLMASCCGQSWVGYGQSLPPLSLLHVAGTDLPTDSGGPSPSQEGPSPPTVKGEKCVCVCVHHSHQPHPVLGSVVLCGSFKSPPGCHVNCQLDHLVRQTHTMDRRLPSGLTLFNTHSLHCDPALYPAGLV